MKIDYKKSQYNYISKNRNKYIVYNVLYNSLSRLNEEEFQQYSQMKFESADFMKECIEQGIIVSKTIDELYLYNSYTLLASKYMESKPNITVTPTMECNARCFYCYEEGVRCGKMPDCNAEKIMDRLKELDLSRGINLTWFGGEPLLNQEWMDHFCKCLKAENIQFSSFIISNGSVIDESVIYKMKNIWNITSIQITFDGSNEEYVKRKAYVDQAENIYYQMLKKVKMLSNSGISVQIRLNIDKDNRDSILELVSDLQQLFYNNDNITYYPAFLTGNKDKLSEREKINFIKQIIEIDKNMLPVNSYLYKLPRISACYFYQKGAFSVDVNGDIFICERKLGHSQEAIGNINEKGAFEYDTREISGRRDECQRCIFLPKCQGGCNNAFESGEVACFIDKYIIIAYLEMI